MTYTIQSAQWGNAEHTCAVTRTTEVGHVVLSPNDTPEEWDAFVKWSAGNPVAEAVPFPSVTPGPPPTKKDLLEKRLGMPLADLKALLAA